MKEKLSKSLYGRLTKELQKTEKGTLIARGYFTSDNKDEVGDIITRGATERALPKYREWKNIRIMHQPKPVGKVLRIGSEDGLEWNEVELEVIDPETVFMVENGLLTAMSVGILIDWEDLDFTEDGGFIINDYQLAEISLVDHPANYDAKLKDLVIDQEARTIVRQYGLEGLKAHFGGEPMTSKKKIADVAEVVEEVVETAETETETIDKDLETKTEEKDLETEIETADASSEVPVEEIVEEKELVEEPVVEEEQVEKTADETETTVLTAIGELTQVTRTLAGLLEEFIRTREVPATEADGDGEDKNLEVDEEVEEEKDLEAPTRKGGVPATDSDAITEESTKEVEKVKDLRQALRKHFGLTN